MEESEPGGGGAARTQTTARDTSAKRRVTRRCTAPSIAAAHGIMIYKEGEEQEEEEERKKEKEKERNAVSEPRMSAWKDSCAAAR